MDTSESDDLPVSPPDQQPRATEWGSTAAEQGQDETIEQRIMQEVPDPDSAYGAPRDEGGLDAAPRVGGDHPDAVPAEDDFLGDGGGTPGQLTDPDEGDRPDVDAEMLGSQSATSGDPASPEEAAMHVEQDLPLTDD